MACFLPFGNQSYLPAGKEIAPSNEPANRGRTQPCLSRVYERQAFHDRPRQSAGKTIPALAANTAASRPHLLAYQPCNACRP